MPSHSLRHAIVQVGEFMPPLQREIDARFSRHSPADALADPALRDRIGGIVTRSNYTVPPELIRALPALRVVATSGVGYDGIPVAQAQAGGIVVTHTPGVLDAAVSELAVGLLLALLRQIPQADRHVRNGDWQAGAFSLTPGLAGRRVGIVGLGRIGRGIAARLAGFDVRLAYAGRPQPGVPWPNHPTALALAREVDVLVVSCPGGPRTHHLIDAAVLQALGPQGCVVNVSRGSVVDEAALCEALAAGRLGGAALDVFETEPLPDTSPLRSLPNVLLSPHAGSGTTETREAMLRLTLDNLQAVLDGHPALTPVPPQPLPTGDGATPGPVRQRA